MNLDLMLNFPKIKKVTKDIDFLKNSLKQYKC